MSTPSSTSALLSLQDTPSGPQGHQDRTAISINEKMAPADSPSRLDKVQYNVDEGLHIPAVITNSQPLCGPPAEDLRSASVLDDNDDILSSYVYNTSTDAESQPSLPQQHQKEFGNNPPSSLTVSSSASGQGWTVHNQPSSLLAPLNVPKLANDPSDTGYTQAKGRLSQRVQVPSTVMILPNLPAGVSLKQLRERSSPRFPLSPRSVSDSGTYTRHHQAPPSMARQRSDIQQPPPFAQYVDTFNTGWAEQAQPPLASPVPSSFVSTDSPRFGSSPTSRHRTELEPLATSSSETSMRQMTLPSPRLVSNVRDSPGWSNIYPRDGGSDNRSLSSVASSSRVISHSRSLSSLTRTGSLMFQRRPSLPTRTESVSESPREEGLVELNNAQFEFIQPQAADSDAGSSHSTVDSLQMGHSSKLVTRPSPNAKERVRSIYITDGQLDQLEVRPVVDKYGFIHNPKRGSCGPDLDVPDAKDAAALEAYRARELKVIPAFDISYGAQH